MRSGAARRLVAPILLAAMVSAAPAPAGTVALTFDDLPVFGPFYTPAQGEDVTTRLLGGLERHHLRAIGFVNARAAIAETTPRKLTAA